VSTLVFVADVTRFVVGIVVDDGFVVVRIDVVDGFVGGTVVDCFVVGTIVDGFVGGTVVDDFVVGTVVDDGFVVGTVVDGFVVGTVVDGFVVFGSFTHLGVINLHIEPPTPSSMQVLIFTHESSIW